MSEQRGPLPVRAADGRRPLSCSSKPATMKLLLLVLLCVSSIKSQGVTDYDDEVVILFIINNKSKND